MRCTTITALVLLTAMPAIAAAQGATTFDPIIYRMAVASVLGGSLPSAVPVAPLTVRLRVPESVVLRGGQVNERLHQFDEIPAGLPERLDALSITPRPVSQMALPPEFTVIPDSADALLAAGEWRRLRQQVRAPRGVIRLTPVAHADGGGTALVGILWECGPGCQRAYAVWLVPNGTGGWQVQGSHRFPLQ